MELTYRQKQQLLTSYRNDGYELQVRLNAKGTVLDAEIVRIELLMDESSIVEVVIAPSFFTQSEPFTCAYPTQQVSDFIDLANYADSPTQTPGLQPVAGEVLNTASKVNEDAVEPVSFNHTTSALMPMQLVLWTLALVIVPAAIILGWVGNGVVKVVREVIPLMDIALVKVLGWLTYLSAYLFGDDDELNQSYEQVKQLMKTT